MRVLLLLIASTKHNQLILLIESQISLVPDFVYICKQFDFLYPVIVLLIDAYLILFFSLLHRLHTLSQKFLFNSESVWCCFIFRGEKGYHTLQEVLFLIMIVIYFLKVCVIFLNKLIDQSITAPNTPFFVLLVYPNQCDSA